MTMVPLEIVAVAIGLSMVVGVIDVLRLPGWAWKKAEEPRAAYAALVGLLPLVGLGMYMTRVRPKAKAIMTAGRAASLPFERFGDGAPPMDEEQVAEAPEPVHFISVQAATALTAAPAAPVVTQPEADGDEAEEAREAEPATVASGSFFSSQAATATQTHSLRLPASLMSRTYNPRQRASISEGRITPAVPAGWKADPTGRHQFRYWNGSHWTENVADAGVRERDSVYA
jgi:Protein of unknown function (DUF2510)